MRSTPRALATALGFSRVVANSMDTSSDRDFAVSFLHAASLAMVHLSRLAEDVIYFTRRGVRVLRAGRQLGHRQQHDAAEEEPRSDGAGARQGGPRHRPPRGAARGDEGSADRLQQGSAGGQGRRVRRRGHAGGLARRHGLGGVEAHARGPIAPARPPRGCCWRPMPPTTWCAAACRSATPTKWSGRMVRELLAAGRDFDDLSLAEWRAYSELFGDDVTADVSALASVRARRTPQSTHPDAVRAALAETRRWLADCSGRRLVRRPGWQDRRHILREDGTMGSLDGKIGLIVGVANKRSLAWAIAQAAAAEGARLVLTYQERFKEHTEELAADLVAGAAAAAMRRAGRRPDRRGVRADRRRARRARLPGARRRLRLARRLVQPLHRHLARGLQDWRSTSAPTRSSRWPAAPGRCLRRAAAARSSRSASWAATGCSPTTT